MTGPDNPRPKKQSEDDLPLTMGKGGTDWPVPNIITKKEKVGELHAQHPVESHDAPHVFRFNCPDCKSQLSLFGRMGQYFVKIIGR